MSAKKPAIKPASKDKTWCRYCPPSDIPSHDFPAHAKTNTPGVPYGKFPPTGRSMALQSGVGEPTVWDIAARLLGDKDKLDPDTRCGYERFTQKRNRPWNYFLPIVKPNGESVLIEDDLTPMTRWVLNYNWLNRGFYPCCDPDNPAGSGGAKIVRKDGYLYPLDKRQPPPCPKDCLYCDMSERCKHCPHPLPPEKCPKDPKDKCKEKKFPGDKMRAPLYREKNDQMSNCA